ncbi:MAG: hypothetical protein L3J52_00670 [Proteobacteria bacterium]|nr:hypothetical protein [Pseudomonadota bacterium]
MLFIINNLAVAGGVTNTDAMVVPSSNNLIQTSINQYDFVSYSVARDRFEMNIYQGFDFLNPKKNGYIVAKNTESMFGDELILGMKFSDLLSLRVKLFDKDDQFNIFLPQSNQSNTFQSGTSPAYQLGVSSVMSFSKNTRFGIELGHGRFDGTMLGLYNDSVSATSFGMGIRSDKFGASFNSDLISAQDGGETWEQSTMDFKIDWHFTKEGTVSFGARKNVSDGNTGQITTIDDLTGTVPYIKFRHNL